MLAAGKSQREVKEYFHLQGDHPIHDLLKQERRREKQLEAGLPLRPKMGACFYCPIHLVHFSWGGGITSGCRTKSAL